MASERDINISMDSAEMIKTGREILEKPTIAFGSHRTKVNVIRSTWFLAKARAILKLAQTPEENRRGLRYLAKGLVLQNPNRQSRIISEKS